MNAEHKKLLLRVFGALVLTVIGAVTGGNLSQGVYVAVHPEYIAQRQNWALTHIGLPLPLLIRSNYIETYRVMGSYVLCGIICGAFIGFLFGLFVVPILSRWLRADSPAH